MSGTAKVNCWGLVPARGGSKSIPHKNLLLLQGRPLLDYVVRAGQASGALDSITCSTDDERIAARARTLGIEVDMRPAKLATDDAKVDDVARELLQRRRAGDQALPEAVVLLQPTSPFLLPQHVSALVELLQAQPRARSVHNVCAVPHNLHAWNQRSLGPDSAVSFAFEAERSRARNKQEKPTLYAFGNLIAARTEALLSGAGFYAKPAYALPIAVSFAFDLDTAADVEVADALLAHGVVKLSHLSETNPRPSFAD